MATWKKLLTEEDGNIGSSDQTVPDGDDRTLTLSSDGSTQFTSERFNVNFDDVLGTTRNIAKFIGTTTLNSLAGITSVDIYGVLSLRGAEASTTSVGVLKLFEQVGDGSLTQHSIALSAPSGTNPITADYTIVLPGTQPSSGNHYLRGNVSGSTVSTSWQPESNLGGTTINNATADRITTVASSTDELDAEANLTYTGTTKTLNLTDGKVKFFPGDSDGKTQGVLFSADTTVTNLNITAGNGSDRVALGLWTTLPCTSSSIPQDKILSLDSNGDVIEAQADDVTTARGLMVLNLASTTTDDFLTGLTYGIANVPNTMINGTFAKGGILYLSDTVAGEFTFLRPSSSGDVVRHMGYGLAQGTVDSVACTQILFAPSSDFVELT